MFHLGLSTQSSLGFITWTGWGSLAKAAVALIYTQGCLEGSLTVFPTQQNHNVAEPGKGYFPASEMQKQQPGEGK